MKRVFQAFGLLKLIGIFNRIIIMLWLKKKSVILKSSKTCFKGQNVCSKLNNKLRFLMCSTKSSTENANIKRQKQVYTYSVQLLQPSKLIMHGLHLHIGTRLAFIFYDTTHDQLRFATEIFRNVAELPE